MRTRISCPHLAGRNRAVSYLAALCLCVYVAAAASGAPNPVQGKWTDADTGMQVEFKHNGSMTEQKRSGAVVDGHYALLDDTHIRLQLPNAVAPSVPIIVTY